MDPNFPDTTPERYDVVIIGAGPIGLACAIEAERAGWHYLLLEKGCICNSIYQYPTNMRFFSTPDLLEIGDVPFITQDEKPRRQEALTYYRRVLTAYDLNVNLYETVHDVDGADGSYTVHTDRDSYPAARVIVATGFFNRPRRLAVPGADLAKVHYYYKEAHPYACQDVLVVGSGNSAAEVALECYRSGARTSLALRGDDFHDGLKYWVRPDIDARLRQGEITAYFNTEVKEIHPGLVVLQQQDGRAVEIPNDFVLAMIGYQPDFELLQRMGIALTGPDREPAFDPETHESNRPGLYIAGVVAGGLCTNRWFIENSREHATRIAAHLRRVLPVTTGNAS